MILNFSILPYEQSEGSGKNQNRCATKEVKKRYFARRNHSGSHGCGPTHRRSVKATCGPGPRMRMMIARTMAGLVGLGWIVNRIGRFTRVRMRLPTNSNRRPIPLRSDTAEQGPLQGDGKARGSNHREPRDSVFLQGWVPNE